jgi:hypothetical protein
VVYKEKDMNWFTDALKGRAKNASAAVKGAAEGAGVKQTRLSKCVEAINPLYFRILFEKTALILL